MVLFQLCFTLGFITAKHTITRKGRNIQRELSIFIIHTSSFARSFCHSSSLLMSILSTPLVPLNFSSESSIISISVSFPRNPSINTRSYDLSDIEMFTRCFFDPISTEKNPEFFDPFIFIQGEELSTFVLILLITNSKKL